MYSHEQIREIIRETPAQFKGTPIKALRTAILVGRRKDPDTQQIYTIYDHYIGNDKIYFVVANGKIL